MKQVLFSSSRNLPTELLFKFVREMAPQRYAYVLQFKRDVDRYNAAIAYVLLCMACNKVVGELYHGENGKPVFKGSQRGIKFSITHSTNIVAIAISNHSIGIDIEQNNLVNREIIQTVCCKNEQVQIQKDNKLATVFWTAKEAISKLRNEDWYSTPVTDLSIKDQNIFDRQNANILFEQLWLKESSLCIASEDRSISTIKTVSADDILFFIERCRY